MSFLNYGHSHFLPLRPYGGEEPAVVLPDVVGVVPPAHAQIQGLPHPLGHAAQAGGEAVGRASRGGDTVGLEKGDAVLGLLNDIHRHFLFAVGADIVRPQMPESTCVNTGGYCPPPQDHVSL